MRRTTRETRVGSVAVGGGAPVSVQSMANVDPHDAKAIAEQANACAERGCDIFRLTVPDLEAAKTLAEVKKSVSIPLVADIHFDYLCALAAIEAGADAVRINPGNIGPRDRVQAVARAAKARNVPVRIGVNLGSIGKDLRDELEAGRDDAPGVLAKSALGHLKLLEDEGFSDVVLSAKASNVADTLAVYRRLAEATDCPLHLGVTEAGTLIPGTVRNSVALGILLSEGIGDTVRVSLTGKPGKEVKVGLEILRSLGLRAPGPAVTSCPTCGRTKVDLMRVATQVEDAMETLAGDPASPFAGRAIPRVAVMGCAVNGPGEARGADVALCGGDGEFLLYVGGVFAEKVPESDAVRRVMEHVVSM